MSSALDKLRAVLPPDRKEHVERLARQTVVMGRTCGGNKGDHDPAAQPWLLAVQRGVALRRVLRLTYRAAGKTDTTRRDVEPLGVAFYGGAWYLVAWCRLRNDLRHFRVERVQHLEMLSEKFPAREEFSLARHLEEQLKRTETVAATVWFASAAQSRARNESYATLVPKSERDGGTDYVLYTYSLAWLARWILSFGPEAEAIEPAELREQMRATAEAAVARYAAASVDA